jgi:transcriptional regulator with XRE-family HTH domain
MRQLAMQVGISHTAISQLEHGKLELPRARVEQLVLACGHSIDDFDRLMGNPTWRIGRVKSIF